jgi:2-iminobutanoate/2-iminopropanoate deaminase
MNKTVISTTQGPSAIGPYSQAIRVGNLVFLSGQIPLDAATGQLITDKNIKAQTRKCLQNIQGILGAAGASMDSVVRTTVFLKDMNEFAAMNEAYGEFFKNAPPARSTVEVARLPRDASVEIDCIAVVES